MAAKLIAISADDSTYRTLPGSQGELSRDGAVIDDTIFGQTFKSSLTGILTWSITANAIFKGYAGYVAKLLKPGTPTMVTNEPCTHLGGQAYQITGVTKRIWDRSLNVVVKDGGVDRTSSVLSIDYLFGKVTFVSTYNVTGAVTVTARIFPTIPLSNSTAYTLTQTADALKDTDFPTAQANGGFNTNRPGLRTISIEIPAIFDRTDEWQQFLIDREELIIEINPDGNSKSIARGFFRLMSDKQSGNVGALEMENLTFNLNVPLEDAGDPAIATPFGWSHTNDSAIPLAVKLVLDAFMAESTVYVKYLPEGLGGVKGSAVVTSATLTGGLETPNSFAMTFMGDGGLTDILVT